MKNQSQGWYEKPCLVFSWCFYSLGVQRVLQAEDLLIQEAMSAMNVIQAFYQRQGQDDAFNVFYDFVVIGEPVLPRYCKDPRRYDDRVPHVQFSIPHLFYCQKYVTF